MPIATDLKKLVDSGRHRIGELEIQTIDPNFCFIVCHWRDSERAREAGWGGLELQRGPGGARDLSIFTEQGEYRFAKGQLNLRGGWVMGLANEEELRQALDLFYPATVGLFLAREGGTLEVENLRDKLGRQTGMYRKAGTISDEGAQKLVREVCGPAHQCAKAILWQIDGNTPLEDSEASRFHGIPSDLPPDKAIPLLCREACNHFVAECCRVAKREA